jgi:Uma2 family endonuclease
MAIEIKSYSKEAYFRILEKAELWPEFYKGTIIPCEGTSKRHNRIKRNCLVRLNEAPGNLFLKSVGLFFPNENIHLFPDLLTTNDARDEVDDYFVCYPNLILEIPSTHNEDFIRNEKFDAYLKIPSLMYLLIISQKNICVELYAKKEKAKGWTYDRFESIEDSISLPALNLNLKVLEIYADIMFDN